MTFAQPNSRQADLWQLLSVFNPATAVEKQYHQRFLELCQDAVDPFSRTLYSPGHFTASAFVLSPSRDEVLLIFHKKLGRWLQPGGHVDADDSTLEAAARREVLEETGANTLLLAQPGILDIDIHTIPARNDEPAHEHFDIRFLFVAPSRQAKAASDAADTRWVGLSEMGTMAADASVLRAISKITTFTKQF